MFSWYRVSSSFSHFPLSNPEKYDIQCPKFSNFVPFTPVTRHSLLPPKENKDLRSSESKLSPNRLVCEGASGQASTFNRNSPRNRALCFLSLSLPTLNARSLAKSQAFQEISNSGLYSATINRPPGRDEPLRSSGGCKGTCQTRSRRTISTLLDPPRDITGGRGRRRGEGSLSAPLLIIRFLDMHTRACWPSSKTGQRAHLLGNRVSCEACRGSTEPMQIDSSFSFSFGCDFANFLGYLAKEKKNLSFQSVKLVNICLLIKIGIVNMKNQCDIPFDVIKLPVPFSEPLLSSRNVN